MPQKEDQLRDQLIELYKIAFDMLSQESTLFWQRAYVFLLIHGAFITAIGIRGVDPTLFTMFGAFGAIFSIIWLAVLKMGQWYVYRWVGVINRLERLLKTRYGGNYLFEMHREEGKILTAKNKFPSFLRKRTTTLIQYVTLIICIFWILIFFDGLYLIVWGVANGNC